ncbi:MAG: class I SAM-dependent methyltransferase [Flavobacteriaceae bacterium]|nr:class I SAM-dependent methyltransferase [Flavobacteriaceae bacterium]
MTKPLSASDLKALEAQLYCPSGVLGVDIGKRLHQNNIGMTMGSVDAMQLSKGDCVLEIGHGNCGHLYALLSKAEHLNYQGLEISELMKTEAERINQELCANYPVKFQLYDGLTLPYNGAIFHKIVSVNTIYFWQEPLGFLNQMYDILQPNGICVIAFALKDFMETLPFVGNYFRLYATADFKVLVGQSKFDSVSITTHEEAVMNKANEPVKRTYAIAVLKKSMSQ